MIDAAEYIQLRQRVLIAAEAAHRIATTPHQTVFYDEEMFELVMDAMLNLKSDIRKLVSECQILRGVADGTVVFTVGGVSERADHPGSVAERLPIDAGSPVGVPAGGADGATTSRPKSRRNPSRNRKPAAEVVKAGGANPVDRSR